MEATVSSALSFQPYLTVSPPLSRIRVRAGGSSGCCCCCCFLAVLLLLVVLVVFVEEVVVAVVLGGEARLRFGAAFLVGFLAAAGAVMMSNPFRGGVLWYEALADAG